MKNIIKIIPVLILFISLSCNKGIEPGEPTGPFGFSGKVTFVGKWPAGIKRTHIVVFKNEIKKVEDFFNYFSFIVDSIPNGAKEFKYNSIDNPFNPNIKLTPGIYSYVVVAQSKTPEITLIRSDWNVVGVYCINGDQNKPKPLIINQGQITTDVNITVDFNNPPPQPPM
ncbi:MAG: hypothetical protein N2321_03050 [Melioribacteraceae bacterium]|nr:hypothetical protein [Melioribacteraceae bacterium]